MTIEEIERLLKIRLSEKRLHHVLEVRKQALKLAKIYKVDEQKAQLAALLHDITKEESEKRQLQKLTKSDIIFSEEILRTPAVYHAKTGMLFARDELGIKDEDILNAVSYHTTGRADMSLLEKIIFVADATSEERKYPGVKQLREASYHDLHRVILELTVGTLEKVVRVGSFLPLDTVQCYNEMLKLTVSQDDR